MASDPEVVPDATGTSLVDVSKGRVRVLKGLDGHRRTVSELARELDLNKSTVHGYLQDLLEDGFVHRHEDDERLWVYYSLSPAGKRLVDRGRLTLAVDVGTIALFLASAALAVHELFFATSTGETGGPGIQTAPSQDSGLPVEAIVYVALTVLVLAGVGLRTYLRRGTVDREELSR